MIDFVEDYPSPAEGNGLENRQACKSVRGFESHILLRVYTLRQKSVSSWFNDFWCLFIRATTACNAWKRIAKVLRAHGSSYRLDNSAGRVADF